MLCWICSYIRVVIQSHHFSHLHTLFLSLSSIPMADQSPKPETFELSNGSMKILLTNLGCTIISLSVPGKDGFFFFVPIPHFQLFVTFDHVCVFTDSWHALCFEGVLSDVVLGLDSVESYEVPFNFAISLIEILASIVMGSFALA